MQLHLGKLSRRKEFKSHKEAAKEPQEVGESIVHRDIQELRLLEARSLERASVGRAGSQKDAGNFMVAWNFEPLLLVEGKMERTPNTTKPPGSFQPPEGRKLLFVRNTKRL